MPILMQWVSRQLITSAVVTALFIAPTKREHKCGLLGSTHRGAHVADELAVVVVVDTVREERKCRGDELERDAVETTTLGAELDELLLVPEHGGQGRGQLVEQQRGQLTRRTGQHDETTTTLRLRLVIRVILQLYADILSTSVASIDH